MLFSEESTSAGTFLPNWTYYRTHAVQAIFARIIVRGVFLRQQEDLLVAGHRCLQGLDGLFPTDEQRDDHVRVHHHVT